MPGTARFYARNAYNSEFSDCVAFFDVDEATRDRRPATAPSSSVATARSRDPAAMHRSRLSGKIGAALDPCAAIQVTFDLADGQQREIVFRLGAASIADAASMPGAALPRDPQPRAEALDAVRRALATHAQRRAGAIRPISRSTC